MQEKANLVEIIMNFIKGKKIYFITLACILVVVLFFVYRNNSTISAEGMMRKADNYAKNGQVAYAIEDYNRIVRLFPKNYNAHVRLAELYLTAGEPDMAKVEYIRAIEVGGRSKYEANFAIANLYIKENSYTLAESYIKDLTDTRNKKALKLLGDFYSEWGNSLKSGNKTGAIRKLKIACMYYKKAELSEEIQVKKNIRNIYIDISNELMNANKPEDAVNILKISMAFWNNAETHYRLAKIYELDGQVDNAVAEYKKAFKLNPKIANPDSYVKLLVQKAEIFKANGDCVSAELYYTWAKQFDKKVNIPMNPDSKIVLSIIAAKSNQDIDKDILIPEIVLKLSNIEKYKISNLKIKVVFLEDNKPFSEVVKVIATEKNPLNNDSSTSPLNIFASKTVKYAFDKHNIQAQVYISQKTPDKWVLFRKVTLSLAKDSGVPVISN